MTQQQTRKERYDEWHAMMLDAGWTPVRDVFGGIHTYQLMRDDGKPIQVTSATFSAWVDLMRTPPPF